MSPLAIAALTLLTLLCRALAHIDEPETCSSVRCNRGDYSYDTSSPYGPAHWGTLRAQYGDCLHGRRQSPFNVLVDYSQSHGNWTRPAVSARLSVVHFEATSNNFKFICAREFGPCSSVRFGKAAYDLEQVHLHSPSEYYISGRQFPLELHFVHRATAPRRAREAGRLAVVAVMLEVGQFNRNLQRLLDAARNRDYAVVDFERLVSATESDMCAFEGSLTTPPCSEGVQWVLSLGRLSASLQQIGEYRAMVGERSTNRPLQEANGRQVICYARSGNGQAFPGII